MKKISVLILLVFVVTVGGVSATWVYSHEEIAPVSDNFGGVTLGFFEFAPEEILPGGGMVDVPLGGDHYVLVDLILNENDKGYGLNINDNVLIHKYLREKQVVYSNQKVSGGNLKFIIDPNNNTHGLYYCIRRVSDTEYYSYTFSQYDLTDGAEIPVYRTTLVKTDIWRATSSYLGKATVKSLSVLGENADPNTVPYSIDVTTWHP